ncbi:hypothetical protein WMY93_006441 [Mugilogobius chulae]|uniref:Reverse transcriptase zinc-binding domain-containing protein n=1 Tax=Mugilogobius chulae TaxID=88201 RepID=A0AAW0PNR6_9GOBI
MEQIKERTLRERLQMLSTAAASQRGPVDPEYLTIKADLDNLEIKRCRGAILRAKSMHIVQGERSTAYFFGLEKQKQSKMFIESLVDRSGKLAKGVSAPCMEVAVDALERKLRPDEAEQCDSPVCLEEVRSAITDLRSGKSPGEDGLTCEFYKRFTHRLIYTRSILHAFLPDRYGSECPVCGESYEDLHHLLIACPAIRPFWTRVQDLLARRLMWKLPPPADPGGGDQLHWFLLFGPFGGQSGANKHLARIVMETARYTIYLVRNIYHFNERSALHWPLLRGSSPPISDIWQLQFPTCSIPTSSLSTP